MKCLLQVEIEQKQVVFYSPDYDKRSKYEREKAVEKARKLIEKGKNEKLPAKGAQKYIASTLCDKETGEIHDKLSDYHFVDREKILEEEKYDGYYVIVTSKLKMPDIEILDAYRNLWKIEEPFKVTKSELKTRSVYLSLREHIEAHFLTCFVSLLLLRLLEKQTNNKYSIRKLVNEMNSISGTYLAESYYMFDHNSEIVKDLGDLVGVDFTKRFITIGEIKSILAKMKKWFISQQLYD